MLKRTFLLIGAVGVLSGPVFVLAEDNVNPSHRDEPHDTTLLQEAPDWESKEFKKEKQEALEKKAAEEQANSDAKDSPKKKKKSRVTTLRNIQR